MKRLLILLIVALSAVGISAQNIPQHQSYSSLYDLLDELANDGIIQINSAVKPYSRTFIASKLQEASAQDSLLSKRQRADVSFYLNDYSLETGKLPFTRFDVVDEPSTKVSLWHPGVFYRSGDMWIRMTPVLGGDILRNKNGTISQRTVGAELMTQLGKHFTLYASLRDNSQSGELLSKGEKYAKIKSPYTSKDTLMRLPSYLTQAPGAAYKVANGTNAGGDFSEMRAGVYYSWDWGNIGYAKDHIQWGDNYHGSNILSGNTPSFPFLALNLYPFKWVELNFFHGWLTSNVIDSTDYYIQNTGEKSYRYRNKYIAANMLTFKPMTGLNISFGNSIIYAERNIQLAYLLPLAFYKSIDHTLTMGSENQNSQMFLNISSRNINHLHLFLSMYIDEFSVKRLKSSNPETNPISWKLGGRLSNYPFKDWSLIAEWTRNNICTYKHFIPAIDYTSSGYTLGSYLWDNSQEMYLALTCRPVRGLFLQGSFLSASHGNEYDYIHKDILKIISQPFMKDQVWTNKTISFSANYEVINNLFLLFNIDSSNIEGHNATGAKTYGEYRSNASGYLSMYTPEYLQGKNLTFTLGLRVGL
ncbi:hypothetical protein [Paludibacter jiangxiensis]|uniref:Capsule assembly protein Wzi n=1 Tax=Paludibacter jiangxiensis TaxID=681398 RepID=A0A170YC20_9BACT|nr:hypothetical protein [Paludibacter jiangxiensis]GAT61682.1 hypothetical protein PJIAN_1265 [Paludibacter jiangxiensis]